MVIFLTSSFFDFQPQDEYTPRPIRDENNFKENISRYWKNNSHVLVFSSSSDDEKLSEHITEEFYDAFTLAGFMIDEIRCFDNRYIEAYQKKHNNSNDDSASEALREALLWADVFYLSGGHAPTENCFINKCGLKKLISDSDIFDGIFIGLSAGSMNAATEVYLVPELPGESINPDFVKFSEGLGLTNINILPHSQYMKTIKLDGKDYFRDIVAMDSIGRELYLIPDGSYFIINNGITEFFGDGQIMENGELRPLRAGIINVDKYNLRHVSKQVIQENFRIIDSIVSQYYDLVLEINPENEKMTFYYISDRLLRRGLIPVHINSFEELISLFSSRLVVKDEREAVNEQIQIRNIRDELVKKGSYVRTIHIDLEEGINSVNFRVSPIDGSKNRFLVCLADISMILDHDWMTDEYSRTGFLNKAEELFKNGKYNEGYSIVYTNIQGFKAINDLLGTFSGDMVIFMERDILIRELNPVLIARLENDHFALITETSNLTEQKLDKLCHQKYTESSKCMPFLIRCGIYHINDTTKKVQYMLDQAKLAEKSISTGYGIAHAVCNQKLTDDYVAQRIFVSEIDSALHNKELLTYYQPIVDGKTGKIVSAEALIRWKHHDRGMIPPNQFIPVFEKEGIISKIDSFMIDNVINFNLERIKKGHQMIPCAVNLSRVDFYDTRLLDMIRATLSKYSDIRNMLKIEVTESAYAVLETNAVSFLREMKKLGLSILLDDFGSGMSSLSTLESFGFDIIKLDIGFTAKIGKNPKSEAIIKHTIGLSHDIGAKVVAEGVESKEQLEFLQAAGCDMIQGYYFYKPMPEEEFTNILLEES